ncbi:MAG: hypothetical protein K6G88_01655, partial [Lachnospiraceae bacterium]|nr:hypothetical protein [Lachnospiraceae bacterium]
DILLPATVIILLPVTDILLPVTDILLPATVIILLTFCRYLHLPVSKPALYITKKMRLSQQPHLS